MIHFVQLNRQRSATVWGKTGIWAAEWVYIAEVAQAIHEVHQTSMPL